jgi:hypothetical protein
MLSAVSREAFARGAVPGRKARSPEKAGVGGDSNLNEMAIVPPAIKKQLLIYVTAAFAQGLRRLAQPGSSERLA